MLQLLDIRKSYTVADFTQVALDDVSIAFRDNEFVAVLGPSGSGKTTMLNVIGGLDHYDSGALIIDGINTSNYSDRDWDTYRNNRIGFVFQSYNLIPHQTVLANVELALTLTGVDRAERRQRATEALIEVGLGDHVNKLPSQLSGGQMQRVAIARALINDPEILLADEPTGALDSTTSVQIMGLLTEIAKDRLVIMVTHNPELAEEYATRIVSLKDGRIFADTDPFDPQEEAKLSQKAAKRASMSFLTAISLSFKNLMTKKGRTLMTAFAGSIGIIGIATILALANGVNAYVRGIEEDTLSVYPLTIQSQGMDMTALLGLSADVQGEAAAGDADTPAGEVSEVRMLQKAFGSVGSNDIAALKTYLDDNGGNIDDFTNLIQYKYNVTPQIFSVSDDDKVRQVNPDSTFAALGFGGASGGPLAAMNSNAFMEMIGDPALIEQQYDVVAGDWPKYYNETVLVLTPGGGISDFLLYAMNLRDPSEMDAMVQAVANGEDIPELDDETLAFSYEEIMNVTFRMVNSADYYVYDKAYDVWADKSGDSKFLRKLVDEGETLNISAIIQPRSGVTATALTPGLYYTPDLIEHLINQAAETGVVKAQLDNPNVNIFTGRTFAEEQAGDGDDGFDMSKMVTIDQDAIAAAFTFDESQLQLDPSALDFSMAGMPSLDIDPGALPSLDLGNLMGNLDLGSMIDIDINEVLGSIDLSGIEVDLNPELATEIATELATGYAAYCMAGNDCTDPQASFDAFMATPEGQAVMAKLDQYVTGVEGDLTAIQEAVTKQIGDAIAKSVQEAIEANSAQLQASLQGAMAAYMAEAMNAISTQVQAQIGSALEQQIGGALNSAMSDLTANMSAAMGIDEAAFAKAFQFNMDENELSALMIAMLQNTQSSFDGNLAALGYADFARPSQIDIYPKDFEAKAEVINVLDDYNQQMEDKGEDDRVITYTDLVGTLMSSVTDIINVVSYVLVAFVAISLIVSSIMIGVITYISVLERKKEIGILRSIGASKKDIRTVFNAETLIVGFVAGVMGILVTLLITLPANAIVYGRFGIANVAILPWTAALILIAISMGLTFMAGLIPSSAASRKDPVEALRSE
ncbi:ABC transporter ATP-binding protein/permease [Actinomyces minihominis]|uniref:ABC transporter ATP-binding protein/permease n=1 Tax=Actinomyces minihominis TaxID=2002838 RepID=UPI000C06B1D8|nr:ABC transporter ATP-binding protein/permease [Actinomyces minihominis]